MQIILVELLSCTTILLTLIFAHNIQEHTIVPIAQITDNKLNVVDKAFNNSIVVEVWVSVKNIIIHANFTLYWITKNIKNSLHGVLILGCSLDNLLVNTNVIIPNINNEMLNGYQIYLFGLLFQLHQKILKILILLQSLMQCF